MAEMEEVQPRPKRQKKDKHGRLAAFDRLKNLKGLKNKCEISEVNNVYETIDEREYSKSVSAKYEDWIVDDDGSGYVEDGRDIFDDDLDEASIAKAAKNSEPKKKKRKAISENAGKGNIHMMLSKMHSKKEKEISLDNDDVLSELINELDDPSKPKAIKPKPVLMFSEKKVARDYMSNFSVKKYNDKLPPVNLESKERAILIDRVDQEDSNSIQIDSKSETVNDGIDVEDIHEIPTKNVDSNKLLFKIEKPCSKIDPKVGDILMNSNISVDVDDGVGSEFFIDDFDEGQLCEMDKILENWNQMQKNQNTDIEFEDDIDFDNVVVDDSDSIFRFFWWDAYEDALVQPGVVFLFGKVFDKESKKYVSCCAVVRNISRKIFLLPRTNRLSNDEQVTILDVYNEFKDEVATEYKINEFKSKNVEKKYAFDPRVPLESEYLEIHYSTKQPHLPADLSGDTFSRAFGTETPSLELLLLEARIRGPCWLDISSYTIATNPITYCAREIICDRGVAGVKVTGSGGKDGAGGKAPPLTVATVYVQPVTDTKGGHEIVLISVLVQGRYCVGKGKVGQGKMFDEHFCVMSVPSNTIAPADLFTKLQKFKATKVQKVNTEKALLNYFLGQISRIDPDLIVGYDLQGYQLNILADRLRKLDAINYSRLSRIRRSNLPKGRDNKLQRILTAGRLVCDIKLSAKELIKSRTYDLDNLCQMVLKIKEGDRIQIEATEVRKMYGNCGDLFKMISLQMQDTAYILNIMYELNVIPLALQITNIAGNVMSRTLLGGRSERNEYLLLHAFTERNYIVPDKKYKQRASKPEPQTRKKPAYIGGLVLDPKVGFYNDLVLLMDFNSLYPSIIQEFNICFTTVRDGHASDAGDNVNVGVLPTEIRKLVESRKQVKSLMKKTDINRDLAIQYHIRQTALKLTANSMYGCLGFANSRFYAKHLAELVTLKGREILICTKELAEKLGYDVIYGDTDSIMINTHVTDYDQVMKIGYKIKHDVNKLYKQVELDIDGVFKFLLLLKKKKYAALVLSRDKTGQVTSTQEHKGLDIVRRDCAQIAVEAGKFVLNHILSESTETTEELTDNIHAHLRQLAHDIRDGKVPLSLLVITKQLTKDPNLYTNATTLPHVSVAKRWGDKGGRRFNAGDIVSYVICNDGTDLPATQRAYHIDEYKRSQSTTIEDQTNPVLKIDTHYYLAQQIHPVVSRLCDPIDGTSAEQLADCLGLDHSVYKRSAVKTAKDGQDKIGVNLKDPVLKYRGAKGFEFTCPSCLHANVVTTPIINGVPALDRCANPDCVSRPLLFNSHRIQNQLQLAVASHTRRYYHHELLCEDPLCTQLTSALPQARYRRMPVCVFCNEGVMIPVYSARDLYIQLRFYEYLMDVNQWSTKPVIEKTIESRYEELRRTVAEVIDKSAYSVISLAYIARIVRKTETLPALRTEIDESDLIDVMNSDDDDHDADGGYEEYDEY